MGKRPRSAVRAADVHPHHDPMTDDEIDAYWAEQARLPLFKRDRLWWAEVAFPTVVMTLFGIGWAIVIFFVL